jgi:hypothetical protein
MTKLSELPIMELILATEEKHGTDVNMVIEAQPIKNDETEEVEGPGMEAEDTDVVWYVEFKDTKKYLNNFDEVRKFFLEDGDGERDPSKYVITVDASEVEIGE